MNLKDLRAAFAGREQLSQDLAAANTRITELEGLLATAQKEASDEKARADGLQTQLDEAEKGLKEIADAVVELQAEQTSVEAKASSKMKETMAQLGVPASELPTNAEKSKEKKITMSSSEFRNLTNAEKMEFSRNGGRLTE